MVDSTPKIYLIRYKQNLFGGAENYLSRVISELQKQGVNYETISTSGYSTNSYKLEIPKWLPSFLKPLLFNLKVCRSLKNRDGVKFSLERLVCCDIYRAGDGVHAEWLKIRLQSEPLLKKIATLLNPLHPIYLFLEKKTFQNAKKIVANSERVKREIINHYGIKESKIEVIYNGVKTPIFDKEAAKNDISNELGIDRNKKLVLFVGSGFYRKGLIHYLKILSQLRSDCLGVIIGKDKHQKAYEDEARKLGVYENLLFLGARLDVDRFYAASDIFLFPTLYEPFSNACLEAMSFGNLLITTKQNGVSEITPHKELIMCTPQNYEIAKQIDAILHDEMVLKRMQKEVRDCAKEFTIERNVAHTLKLISSSLVLE